VATKRTALEERIARDGFAQTMETLAYTWFNRLVAIRFMELHSYLDHGYRVLSHREGKPTPEILEHAEHVDLLGLEKSKVIELKLEGTKEAELYRMLLLAQCNALNNALPFLFEKIDDETELLLPDNLLHSDSLIRKLVYEIDERDWQEVEIIGWLYQFYISERKDQVIGKVVASEDIPAATQLFTPNWIVKYLVQNALGRQWLATYPHSALRQQMEYYIEPTEQTPEVQEQLKAITPTSLNPEELTLLDPACGSGHILVEAYDLFKAIYQEWGYRAKDIPALILNKNLFGLEIDDRAAQLAAFALMMKARADDRRIFDSDAKPNILAFEDSQEMNAPEITFALNAPINKDDVPSDYLFDEIQEEEDGLFSKKALAEKGHVSQSDIAALLELFENAKTFGSLIQVPPKLAAKLPEIEKRLGDVLKHGDLTHASAHVLKPLLQQGKQLSRSYHIVVANPPFLNRKNMSSQVKSFGDTYYSEMTVDLFAMFIYRADTLCTPNGRMAFVTPFLWMFNSSYESVRTGILSRATITTLAQLEYNGFEPACVPVCLFSLFNSQLRTYMGAYINLSDFKGVDLQPKKTLEAIHNRDCEFRFNANTNEFESIPGHPIAYWISPTTRAIFQNSIKLQEFALPRQGTATANNSRFLKLWFEVPRTHIATDIRNREQMLERNAKWLPHSKGGSFRRWYGNNDFVIDWENDGEAIRKFGTENGGRPKSRVQNTDYFFRSGVTWSDLTSSFFGGRLAPEGFTFNITGPTLFPEKPEVTCELLLGYVNSKVFQSFLDVSLQGMHYNNGVIGKMPFMILKASRNDVENTVKRLVALAKDDWDSVEISWEFGASPIVARKADRISSSWELWSRQQVSYITEMVELERCNNAIFIREYGLSGELMPDVPESEITLYRPDRAEDIKRLLSYDIGCMMGRYSLDKLGLIYAHSSNQGFDPSQYKTFRADDDGIIPLLETDWGIRDDAANRIVEFIGVAWPMEHLEENLKFTADSLGPNNGEQPRDTIRRYLAMGFYKHHLSMYKNRPIYWLFSSGKQRAFQCFVYLHRYHEGTLARMRTEYVIPLQGKIAARLEQLTTAIPQASSTSQRKSLEKKRDMFLKQQTELRAFDEKLRHYADKRIALDLDDGVKVNYGKFGDLLAEVKAVTGGTDED
jgi:SAM-dependent methyltransferase